MFLQIKKRELYPGKTSSQVLNTEEKTFLDQTLKMDQQKKNKPLPHFFLRGSVTLFYHGEQSHDIKLQRKTQK